MTLWVLSVAIGNKLAIDRTMLRTRNAREIKRKIFDQLSPFNGVFIYEPK